MKPRDLEPIAKWLAESIVSRTKQGKSATGGRFKRLQDGSTTDLVDTGAMLGSVKGKVTPGLVIEVEPDVEYAKYVQSTRPFMGLTPQDIKGLTKRLQEVLDKDAKERNNKR